MTKVMNRLRNRRQRQNYVADTRLTDDLEREMLKALAYFKIN
jgi:hypothetical protein